MARIAVFDYGAGNIFSIRNALERAGAGGAVVVDVVSSLGENHPYSGLVLPGVGSFDPAMRALRAGLPEPVMRAASAGTLPVLGICLGMEAFFERSAEGSERGLGLVPGEVAALPGSVKVPHMGWNSLEERRPSALLDGVDGGAGGGAGGAVWAYFVHSYVARPAPAAAGAVAAEAEYGERVPAVIEDGCIAGTQFHPEKSGAAGRLMLANFLRGCSK